MLRSSRLAFLLVAGLTWGLIAAVLENANTHALFSGKGDPVVREIKDLKAVGSLRCPQGFSSRSRHCPPIGKTNWQEARARLFCLKREINKALRALEDVRQLCLQTPATTSGGRSQPCGLGGAATGAGCQCQSVPC